MNGSSHPTNGKVQGYDALADFDRLVELMRTLGEYWVEFVELPD